MHSLFIVIPLLLLLLVFFLFGSRLKTFLNYREAHYHEWPQLKELGLTSYSTHKKMLESHHWQTMENNLMKDENWQHLVEKAIPFICEDNHTIVGMAFLVPSGNAWDVFPADTAYIRMVGVHPDHTGNGIAKKLTIMCIERARQNGEKTLMLHTSEFMDAARHIYEGLGFRVEKEIEPRFGKRYWLYKLDL
jgi:ribosomal protein S18 acetylase RimI-like enzyme